MCFKCRIILLLLLPMLLPCVGCGQDASSSLKGQSNATMTFHGLTVDQAGNPIEGVQIEIEVEAIPPNWNFEKRGEPHNFSKVSAESGKDGRFRFDIVGHILRFKRVERSGYRHFYDLATGNSQAVDNTFYLLSSWGDLCYKFDPTHPAVFVLVKDGLSEVNVLPCRGGYDSGNGKHWRANAPGLPKRPSLKGIVYKPPATLGGVLDLNASANLNQIFGANSEFNNLNTGHSAQFVHSYRGVAGYWQKLTGDIQ